MKRPFTVLAIAAAVAGSIGFVVAPQGYIVGGGLLAIMLIGIIWPWLGMVGLQASIRFQRRRTREGERVGCTLAVRNRMPWPAWGLVIEGGFVPLDRDAGEGVDAQSGGGRFALAHVAGFSHNEFHWNYDSPCSGEYPTAEPKLVTSFPFGLWKGRRPIRVESRLLVWPRLVRLSTLAISTGGRRALGTTSDRRCGYEGDVVGTRAFRPGDLLRHVHWSQTARQGQLIVCERQAGVAAAVCVTIDANPTHHWREGTDSTRQWTMRVATSICDVLLHHGTRLTVDFGGELYTVEPGTIGHQRLNDAFARYQFGRLPLQNGTSRRRDRRCHRRDESEIFITTSRGARAAACAGGDRRLVLLHGSDEGAVVNNAWIELDTRMDVLEQLRREWERLSFHA